MLAPATHRLPLTDAQHGIWLGQQLDLANPAYTAAECVELRGPFVLTAFEQALRQTLEEAEALHVRFLQDQDRVVQLWAPPGPASLQVVELACSAEDARSAGLPASVETWARADLARPMDLTRGPLVREVVLRAGAERTFWYQAGHHAVLDGFGFSLLTERVAELYTALLAQKPLPPRRFGSLKALVDDDLRYRSSPEYQRDRDFWQSELAGAPTPVTFATQQAFPARHTLRQADVLDDGIKRSLDALARPLGGSWADAALAVVATLLHAHTGADEVVLGLPVMGRLGSVALRVPAMVMNIVPLRIDVGAADGDARALTQQVVGRLRALRPHARYRYEQLRRDLNLVGGKRRLFGPVVNIMPFDLGIRFGTQRAELHALSAGPVEDLSIAIRARGDGRGPCLQFDANPGCYSHASLGLVRAGFMALAQEFAVAPRASSTSASRANPPRKTSLFEGAPLAVPATDVVERILGHASALPARVALEVSGERLSYAELVLDARRLAGHLLERNAGPGCLVGILLPRGRPALTAMLACLMAGAAYLPLDPDGPQARLHAILDEAKPALVFAELRTVTRDPKLSPASVLLLEDARDTQPLAELPTREPEQPAYVIYTSGSTGKPNGVVVSRGALAHFVQAGLQRYGWSAQERVLQFAPLHFDASVEEVFLTWSVGATLVVRSDDMLQSLAAFVSACEAQRISVLDLPTAFWHELTLALSERALRLPNSIHTVIIGGEAALPERVRRWQRSVGPGVRLLNTYGPTETTVVATCADLTSFDGSLGEALPIGLPLPGVTAAIVNEAGELAAPGAAGELYLLGPGLALGYLGDSELSAQRFTPLRALSDAPRAYRTGDFVQRGRDGQLVFVGRSDEQIKISGQRIELREVEEVLASFPGVREVAVIARRGQAGELTLSAYLGVSEPALSVSALRRHARRHLLAAAVPAQLVLREDLPKTTSGKLDRKALAALAQQPAPEAAEVDAASASALESLLMRIWREVLGVSTISRHDDFFERGGQSLQTLQVANRLSVELSREVKVALLFDHPTVAQLAEALTWGVEDSKVEGTFAAMLADGVLPFDLAPVVGATSAQRAEPGQVLLTGATGFVGPHLLRSLLDHTPARVVCPVRANDGESAGRRVEEALRSQGLSTAGLAARVMFVPAQLSEPDLGLDARTFAHLASECDAVFHNAASVNLVRSYESARVPNVLATREVLRFAMTGRAKVFHHVSTIAVGTLLGAGASLPEDFITPSPGIGDGYTQSKWVAERLVEEASRRGLDVSVYRLGRVVGSTSDASINRQDLVWRILSAGVALGALPELDVAEPWTPVNIVARAMIALATSAPRALVFNMAPERSMQLSSLFGWLHAYGYALPSLDMGAFRERLNASTDAEHRALASFFEQRSEHAETRGTQAPAILGERTLQALRAVGLDLPEVQRELVYRYFDTCVRSGVFERP